MKRFIAGAFFLWRSPYPELDILLLFLFLFWDDLCQMANNAWMEYEVERVRRDFYAGKNVQCSPDMMWRAMQKSKGDGV